MTARLRRIVDRAEQLAQERCEGQTMTARLRQYEITLLVDATPAERITLTRIIHAGPSGQVEAFKAALARVSALYEDAERRWEAGQRPGR